ncbi:hypothetical protein OBBRIDRAFT_257913 [Obba rivulosa]|uniref:F-box domain-containing protein n=1 Tax=Obba rivulosa TaxID=1052685 RepID=A0A8E2APT2_9APHY|nr:hypothetical protein OBBRIDRAFT_257913 [Obba rivulosa]
MIRIRASSFWRRFNRTPDFKCCDILLTSSSVQLIRSYSCTMRPRQAANSQCSNLEHWKSSLAMLTVHHVRMSLEETEELELALDTARATVRRERNSMLPVHRLPPELLTKIFYYAPEAAVSREEVVWNPTVFRLRDVAKLMAVCGRWREIVENTAILWSSVSDWDVETFSQRAQHVRLACHFRQVSSEDAIQQFLRTNGLRIREFHILESDIYSLDLSLLHELEAFSLAGFSWSWSNIDSNLPRLRSLALRNCIGFPRGPLPSLTQVSLRNCDIHDISSLLRFLSQVPNLRDLHLKDCLPRHVPQDIGIATFAFKHLRRLVVDDEPAKIAVLLSHMALKSGSAVVTRSDAPIDTVKSAILRTFNVEPITKLAIIRRRRSLTLIICGPTSAACHSWSKFFGTVRAQLPSIMDLIPEARPRELWVYESHSSHMVTKQWVKATKMDLPGIPDSVEAIVASVPFFPELLRSIDVPDNATSVACPVLRTVHILVDGKKYHVRRWRSPWTAHLSTVAARRANAGHPIQRVKFTSFHTSSKRSFALEGIRALRSMVDHVDRATQMDCPIMEMPLVCTLPDGPWWPSWVDKWDLRYPDTGWNSDEELCSYYDMDSEDPYMDATQDEFEWSPSM